MKTPFKLYLYFCLPKGFVFAFPTKSFFVQITIAILMNVVLDSPRRFFPGPATRAQGLLIMEQRIEFRISPAHASFLVHKVTHNVLPFFSVLPGFQEVLLWGI